MDATNDAKSTDQPEPTFTNKPVNFADLQFGNELHATTSAISLHKTNASLWVKDVYLAPGYKLEI